MILVGGLLMLAGVGWAVWRWADRPPPPVEMEAGAVVLAITATPTASPEPTAMPTPSPTVPPGAPPVAEPTKPQSGASLTPTAVPPAPTPSPIPTATPIPQPPTRIVASSIKLDAPVVAMGWKMVGQVAEWDVPKDAAGWHINSALAGQPGNTVLSGHHNIEGKVFRYVVDLEIGDEIVLYAGDSAYAYTVTEKYILKEASMPWAVRLKNAQWIAPTVDERLTLVTCWPYEWPGITHRVIVVAKPKPDPERKEGKSQMPACACG
jgi:sortase A